MIQFCQQKILLDGFLKNNMYILGIITGLLLAIIVFLASRRYGNQIERTLKQAENSLREKGEIYIDTDEKKELEILLDNLPIE